MPFLASKGCFWPLTASMTSEVKKNHAHVYPYRNLSNFSEINFSIWPMVWPWIALSVHQDFLGNKINEHGSPSRTCLWTQISEYGMAICTRLCTHISKKKLAQYRWDIRYISAIIQNKARFVLFTVREGRK